MTYFFNSLNHKGLVHHLSKYECSMFNINVYMKNNRTFILVNQFLLFTPFAKKAKTPPSPMTIFAKISLVILMIEVIVFEKKLNCPTQFLVSEIIWHKCCWFKFISIKIGRGFRKSPKTTPGAMI